MNYLLVSPNFPTSQESFARKLVEKGVRVLGIGSESYDNLSNDLKNTLTEYYRVNDLENYEEVLRGVAFLIYKHGVIDRVESNNEYWLTLDSIIREQFNIPGVKPKNLDFTKYKSKMKERFIKAEVPVAKGRAVKTIKELEKAIKEIKLPVIAKPDNGVGANNTYKLLSKKDVENFKKQWIQEVVYFIESYIDNGILCTYDGLIDSRGEVVFETSFYYTKPTLDLLNDSLDYGNIISKEIDPKLRDYGRKIVKEFGMKERFFHIEFFKTKDDYIAIEYNNRPAGAFAVDVYNFAHSTDYFRVYAEVVNGTFNGLNVDEKYGLASTRRDYKDYVHSDEDIRNKYQDKLKAVLRMPEAFAELQGNTMYVLVADTLEEMKEMERFVGKLK